MQDILDRLAAYWSDQGCLIVQPMNNEVGAGTLNPATFLRVLGPQPWRVAYVEPSVRPDDARYGQNPNRIQCHHQYQVILKPEPGDAQQRYLGSLEALGIDVAAHDIRFVEDNWAAPAVGAWGLGWEVWLDGLEITQFTYFQQVGGISLPVPPVEITYGIERIVMALQGVTHFKEIEYAPGVKYGDVFGQGEYEWSRYYLDDADVATNRQLLQLYAAEAQRMVDAGLAVPAHSYLVKCSHAFNVLDARGAVSTAERAAEFARMRRLAGDVARLWLERDTVEVKPSEPPPVPVVAPAAGSAPRTFTIELGTEEMPPAEARAALAQLRREVAERLGGTRLPHGEATVFATPRRLVAIVEAVGAREEDAVTTVRGPRVSAAYDASGAPTKALLGFARGQGVEPDLVERIDVGGVEHVAVRRPEPGRPAAQALREVVEGTVAALRSGKNMRWSNPALSFTRPIRRLLALWGDDVVPAVVGTLVSGRSVEALRTVYDVTSAESYVDVVTSAGVVLDPLVRRERVLEAAAALASGVGGTVDIDAESGLVDQIVYLVEQPSPLLGRFDESYLRLPEAVLTTVMRKHQRYLPVRSADGTLLPYFVAVANGQIDIDRVRAGNEAVLRARYEDAAFFYRADREVAPLDLKQRLAKLTFTDKLGPMADRAGRIAALALTLGSSVPVDRAVLARATELVKFDLGSQLVTELTGLAGVMARDYALHAGEPAAVAEALFEAELPRQAGDAVPSTVVGGLLSLADRLDFVVGLAATVGLPTGSSDPFAVRRAVLGMLAVHRAIPELGRLSLVDGLASAAGQQPVEVGDDTLRDVREFLARRLEQQLVEEGQPPHRVRAVLRHSDRPYLVDTLLGQLSELDKRDEFRALVEALQRSARIVPAGTAAAYDPALLTEPAERRLHEVLPAVRAGLPAGVDLPAFVDAATPIVEPVTAFFNDVFVMVDDPAVRAARLGLLASVAGLGATQLDWHHL
jgi:glycyl-tRNA synthetase